MTTRVGVGLATIGLGVLLSACGGSDFSDQSGQDIADASKAAMKKLTSVKVSGSVKTNGQEVTIDMQSSDTGDCTGSIGVAGGKAELLGADGTVWFKPDEAFWRASAGGSADQIIALVGDKWVVVPPNGGFDQFCDTDELLDGMLTGKDDDTTYTKGDVEEVDRVEAIPVKHKSGDGSSTGFVRVDAPHYLVKIEKADGDDSGNVTFSEFDTSFEVEAPAPGDIVDLDNLKG